MTPLRVLHVIPSVAPRYGGPSEVIGPMCGALRDAGVDARIATTDADGDTRLSVPLGAWTEWRGVPTLFFRRDASEAFKYSRGLGAWLRAHVAEFDLVHIHAVLSHAPLAAAAACRRYGVPYIVRPLGTIASWSLGRKAWRKKLLLSLAARRMLRGAAALHFTTDEEQDDAVRTFGLTQGTVIPLGLDIARFAPTDEEQAHRDVGRSIVFLSRLHPKKNLEALLDAFADLQSGAASGWQLAIAGGGDSAYREQLESRAARNGLHEQVSFVGWVEGEQKRALLANASLFVLPSHHENFGVSVLEAMAAHVPVMISRGVQLSGDVERAHAGWICGTSRAEVGASLAAALGDPSERRARAEAAGHLAARFAWPAVTSDLVACYTRIATTTVHAASNRTT